MPIYTSRRRWRAAETSTRPLGLTNLKKTKWNRMRRSPLTRLANRRNFSSIFKSFRFMPWIEIVIFLIGNVYAFFVFSLSARTTPFFNFVLRTFVCLFLAFYPFPRWNTRLRFFRLILAYFCAFSIFATVFSIFWWWFFPKWLLDVCLSDTSCVYMCAYEKKCKIDLGVYLSWYKRNSFSYAQKTPFGT